MSHEAAIYDIVYEFLFIQEANWKPMDLEGQTDQLGTLCGEMESLGVENFDELIVGKWLHRKELELRIRNR